MSESATPTTSEARAVASLILRRPPRLGAVRLVAVDGPSGSGKTTFAAGLAAHVAAMPEHPTVRVVSTDLLATWDDPFGWWSVLDSCLLMPLAAGHPADLPFARWVQGRPEPGGTVRVPVVDVLVLEGVSSGRSAVRDRLSALVWLEVPSRAERLERAVARDGEESRPFLIRWQQDEEAHFAADRTADRADVVVAG